MKVKKYRAASMPEAMKLIRSELGNEAIILNSRVIQTGGFLGLFKKNSIEVIAALDAMPGEQNKPAIKEKQKPVETLAPPTKTPIKKSADNQNALLSEDLQKELTELKALLKNVKLESNEGIPLPDPIQDTKRWLTNQGIDQELMDSLMKASIELWYTNGGEMSRDEVRKWARDYLIKQINHLPFGGISFAKKYILVVGPTGVGKTTTLAKVAADCILKYKKKVAFITTDTYRIAAIEQLKTYANILNVPIEVCYNLEDFQKAAQIFSDYDLVFIDTAGRNFRNRKYVEDLNQIIDFQKDIETFLVLSLTSKQIDMEEIYQQFSLITIDKMIFSKADETSTFGSLFNMIYKKEKAVAYITNGQNVPDDFITATPENVVNRIIGVD
ncbi:flagellar biosynthesis protein FlhF [Niallia oryzisoli]|uniref:flagellar biosynthesis protein FlhF n=1 Tax=Niallia oryzisoli TaxID=1737571 RepID=UPI0037368252